MIAVLNWVNEAIDKVGLSPMMHQTGYLDDQDQVDASGLHQPQAGSKSSHSATANYALRSETVDALD